jgi:D-alanine-D-alanine ligase
MMKILLITGSAGAVQGWGDLNTTENICKTIKECGIEAEILWADTIEQLIKGLDTIPCDIAWSSLYHVSFNESYVGLAANGLWVADVLDERGIPYIGSSAPTMKQLIDKAATTSILQRAGIPVPKQYIVNFGEKLLLNELYSWFVKPCFESESNGISEESIVHSSEELEKRLEYIHKTFRQRALVEEYLPGEEITVAVIGNGDKRKILPVLNVIKKGAYKRYPLITGELKVKDMISFEVPKDKYVIAVELAEKAANVLNCHDHVRIDMREDANKNLKVIEVNGIPGLNPIKSRSLQIHSIYNTHYSKKENFKMLIDTVVNSAIERYKLKEGV